MSTDVQAIFNAAAADYDQQRRQLVPDFARFYGAVLDLIPYAPLDTFHVLDVGAGTGLLSALIAERFPRATFTLVDTAEAMLDKARERFAGRENVAYLPLDFVQQPIEGSYDVAVSALALHHATGEQFGASLRHVQAALRIGGLFINADQALGTSPENEGRYEAHWQASARAAGSTNEQIAQAVERMKADRTMPLEAQLRWMRSSGFGQVECWYKNYRFVVCSGVKKDARSKEGKGD